MSYFPALVSKNGIPMVSNPSVINFVTDGTVEESPTGTARIEIPTVRGGLFGDGSDGDATITAETTIARDMFYDNLTIDEGAVLNTASYRLFVAGTLTNNGTIKCVGTNGVLTTNGAAVAEGSLPCLGNPATTISNGIGSSGVTGNDGGAGGDGNIDSGSAGQAGGAAPTFASLSNATKGVRQFYVAIEGRTVVSDVSVFFYGNGTNALGGNGGSGGGGDIGEIGAVGEAGGAGGNGGFMVICCKILAGTGIISVKGGDGANGTDAVASTETCGGSGGGAGGNGGNGGILVIAYGKNLSTNTFNISGGTAGTGGAGGAGYTMGSNGEDGTNGITGIKMEFNLG